MIVVGTNDFFRGMLVGIGRHELHDDACYHKPEHYPWHDGPMVMKVVGEHNRPKLSQDYDGDGGDHQASGNPDDGGDQQPLVQVTRVGCAEVLVNEWQ